MGVVLAEVCALALDVSIAGPRLPTPLPPKTPTRADNEKAGATGSLVEEQTRQLVPVIVSSMVSHICETHGNTDHILELEQITNNGQPNEVLRRTVREVTNEMLEVAELIDKRFEEKRIWEKIVTEEMFMITMKSFVQRGGVRNLGGISVAIYTACRFAYSRLGHVSISFLTVMKWLLKFIYDYLVTWITELGGWAAAFLGRGGAPPLAIQ